ncbi:unnamed protein product [Ectocarpus sp. CCAP 1310/34]|nr:unnamed protein product [Ectocarpus sp. CCAP 1310/34]
MSASEASSGSATPSSGVETGSADSVVPSSDTTVDVEGSVTASKNPEARAMAANSVEKSAVAQEERANTAIDVSLWTRIAESVE